MTKKKGKSLTLSNELQHVFKLFFRADSLHKSLQKIVKKTYNLSRLTAVMFIALFTFLATELLSFTLVNISF